MSAALGYVQLHTTSSTMPQRLRCCWDDRQRLRRPVSRPHVPRMAILKRLRGCGDGMTGMLACSLLCRHQTCEELTKGCTDNLL